MNFNFSDIITSNLKDQHEELDFKSIDLDDELINKIRSLKYVNGMGCPYCGGTYVVKYGKHRNHQRYKCKNCNKTFTDLTFSPLNGTHYIEKWSIFIYCMIKGYSLRKAQEILKVTWVSLFYWRHKILTALKQINVQKFQGIVEMDDIYFPYSEKGSRHIVNRRPRERGEGYKNTIDLEENKVCVLAVRDRRKNTFSKVTCLGKILKETIDKTIGSKLCEKNQLCTDNWREYKGYARKKGISHHVVNSVYCGDKNYHIRNINNYNMEFSLWLEKFRGVASKYLNNYLSWFKILDSTGFKDNEENVLNIFIKSCGYKVDETFDSLRTSAFSI